MPPVSLSALDTQRFGVPIARAPALAAHAVPEALAFCRANGVKMLIARCAAEDLAAAQALEEAGGRLMDVLVYWSRPLDRPAEAPAAPVRLLRPDDAPAVREVAGKAFQGYFGHYHADPRLDRAKADAAYASWAERSCVDPGVASKVLVVEHEGRIAGFLTLLPRGAEEQEIVLNGVDPAFQRHGLYRALVLAAIAHARDTGARRIVVSTQLINLGVQKTWARCGFELAQSYYTFHVWFDGAAGR
jgi:GNAT superfamily N-acetyltransferase